MTDWSAAEVADAGRDVGALLRASIEGRHADTSAILDGAGDRGTRCIAETLLAMTADFMIRLTVAVSVVEDNPVLELVGSADHEALLADPDIRAAVEVNLARVQAAIIGGG
jgi:hypothetical protein